MNVVPPTWALSPLGTSVNLYYSDRGCDSAGLKGALTSPKQTSAGNPLSWGQSSKSAELTSGTAAVVFGILHPPPDRQIASARWGFPERAAPAWEVCCQLWGEGVSHPSLGFGCQLWGAEKGVLRGRDQAAPLAMPLWSRKGTPPLMTVPIVDQVLPRCTCDYSRGGGGGGEVGTRIKIKILPVHSPGTVKFTSW